MASVSRRPDLRAAQATPTPATAANTKNPPRYSHGTYSSIDRKNQTTPASPATASASVTQGDNGFRTASPTIQRGSSGRVAHVERHAGRTHRGTRRRSDRHGNAANAPAAEPSSRPIACVSVPKYTRDESA